jgi:hypothetical protein
MEVEVLDLMLLDKMSKSRHHETVYAVVILLLRVQNHVEVTYKQPWPRAKAPPLRKLKQEAQLVLAVLWPVNSGYPPPIVISWDYFPVTA